MNAEVWRQIDDVFKAAVELEPARRSAFLDIACGGDQVVRGEVESLLTADSFDWNFIDAPALESATVLLADDEPRLTPGEQLGHYEIQHLIGKGGMGEVYLARDLILNRNVALKLLPRDYTRNDDRLQRFRREAETVSALNHPNIITIFELGSDDGRQFIATELIEGDTLRAHINRGPLSVEETLDVAIQTATALAAAHKAGVVHRDIKPENIMLRPDGYVKVLDFGLAKLALVSEPPSRPMTGEPVDISSGLLLGTVRYMSPEQADGLPVDARSDIYSLGVVLYEMITSRPPLGEKDRGKLVESIMKDEPPVLDGTTKGLGVVVAKMLSKKRHDRYQDADALLTDLKDLRGTFGIDNEGRAPTDTVRTEGTLTRSAIGSIALLVLVSAIGFGSYRFFRIGSKDDKPPAPRGSWITKASISAPRLQAEPAVLNGVLYVAGGWNVCTPFADLESYDPETDTWTQRAPMLTARGAHGVGVLDGKLYAVGGSTDCGRYTATVEAYDPAANSWSTRAPLPAVRRDHVVGAAAGKLYAVGGMSTDNAALASNTQYDAATDSWTERAPMPTARAGATAVVVQGVIYVLGGRDGGRPVAAVEAYDPTTDSWTPRRSMPTPRARFAAAELNGIIYILGGDRSDEVEAYDTVNDSWAVVGQMPSRRQDIHAATLGRTIYFAGGLERNKHVSGVMAFTPEPADRAAACFILDAVDTAPMPTARLNMAVGEIGRVIYVAGGFDGNTRFLATNEAYDPVADRWTTKSPMPTERETTASAVVEEKLYVIGGNARGECTNVNQAYDPKTDTWATKAPMPTARCHLSAAALDGLIYAFGGSDTSGAVKYATVEVYDPAKDTWTSAPPMPTGRQDLAAVALNGELYAVGGWNPGLSPEFLDVVEMYDPIAAAWTRRAPMPTPRAATTAAVMNGMLIAVGGENGVATFATADAYDPVRDSWMSLPAIPMTRAYSSGVVTDNAFHLIGGAASIHDAGSLTNNTAFRVLPCSVTQSKS